MVGAVKTPASQDIRHRLASSVVTKIRQRGLTQSEAATIFGVGQPRVSDLFQNRLERFSIEMLLQWLESLGEPISFSLITEQKDIDIFRVLLVEDNDDDADLLVENLDAVVGFSAKVERVEDLKSAIHRATSDTWHVVLLDLNLPDSYGTTTLQTARAAIPDSIPIIVLTGVGEMDTVSASLAGGAQNFLVKGGKNFGIRVASALITALGR